MKTELVPQLTPFSSFGEKQNAQRHDTMSSQSCTKVQQYQTLVGVIKNTTEHEHNFTQLVTAQMHCNRHDALKQGSSLVPSFTNELEMTEDMLARGRHERH